MPIHLFHSKETQLLVHLQTACATTGYTKPVRSIEYKRYATMRHRSASVPATTVAAVAENVYWKKNTAASTSPLKKKCFDPTKLESPLLFPPKPSAKPVAPNATAAPQASLGEGNGSWR